MSDRRIAAHGCLIRAAVLLISACALAGSAFADKIVWVGQPPGSGAGGAWDNPKNWKNETNPKDQRVPGDKDDVVIPKNSGKITMPRPATDKDGQPMPIKVRSLTLEDSDDDEPKATVLRGKFPGGAVRIKADGDIKVGKNDKITGGGGYKDDDKDLPFDEPGGDVKLEAGDDVENKGNIEGGPGGDGDGEHKGATDGGDVEVKAGKKVKNDGKITGGAGGDEKKRQRKAADGGNAKVTGGEGTEGDGETSGGKGGAGTGGGEKKIYDGRDGKVTSNVGTSGVFLPGTALGGQDVSILADSNGSIVLAGLPEASIHAAREVFLGNADGTARIDLSGIPAGVKVITAGRCVHISGTILTDPGVMPADLIDPAPDNTLQSCAAHLSELILHTPGGDDARHQAIEITFEQPFATVSLSVFIIDGDPSAPGIVRNSIAMDVTLGANGLLLLQNGDEMLKPAPDPDTTTMTVDFGKEFPRGAATFVLALGDAAPAVGEDLDGDDNGELDAPLPGLRVLDAVSFRDSTGQGREYARDFNGDALGAIGSYVPDALYRILFFHPGCEPFDGIPWWTGGKLTGDSVGPWNWSADANFGFDQLGEPPPEKRSPHLGAPNDPAPCPPTGACCLYPGQICQPYPAEICRRGGGEYLGDGTVCDPNPCTRQSGACCLGSGDCSELVAEACGRFGGSYQGDDTTCDSVQFCYAEPCWPDVTRYVSARATGANDGSSWSDAFTSLQDALDHTADCFDHDFEFWVAEGTYRPDRGSLDRGASFALRNRVAIYGGFAGDESVREARDPASHPTILSGDLNGDDDADGSNNAENSYQVLTATGVDASAVLDGFHITGGNANGPSDGQTYFYDAGGGIRIDHAAPTIANCLFIANGAQWGGGVEVFYGAPILTNCLFSQNKSANEGGGLHNNRGSVTLVGCTFADNQAEGFGGGMRLVKGSATVTDTQFLANAASGGGAILLDNLSAATFDRVVIRGNASANNGGAVYVDRGSTPVLSNVLIEGNIAGCGGGAAYVAGSNSQMTMLDCTITQNRATSTGGVHCTAGTTTLANAIFYYNEDNCGSGESAQLHRSGGAMAADYCCIAGWTGALGGTGNFGDAPKLISLGQWSGDAFTPGDAHLDRGSPCIDAGENVRIPGGATLDLDGAPRCFDGDGDSAATVDIGAYEVQSSPPINRADLNCDGSADFNDIDPFVTALISRDDYESQHPHCNYLNADINRDGTVDFDDIDGFVECLINNGCP